MRKSHDGDTPKYYRIRIKGHLDQKYAGWLDGLSIEHENGITILSGLIVDQPHLHGLLNKIRDLNLVLLSVEQLDPPE
jgi:hypothetical protein